MRLRSTARRSTESRNRDHRRLSSVDTRPFVTAINSDESAPTLKWSTHLNENEELMKEDTADECVPLFCCSGKAGVCFPRRGKATFERLDALRNVARPFRFHNLAFFDPVMYECLRLLICHVESKDGAVLFSTSDINFSIDLCQEEGGCSVELIPNDREVDVIAANVYDYVGKYSERRMFKCQREAFKVSSQKNKNRYTQRAASSSDGRVGHTS